MELLMGLEEQTSWVRKSCEQSWGVVWRIRAIGCQSRNENSYSRENLQVLSMYFWSLIVSPVPANSPTIPIYWGNPHPKIAGFTMQNAVYLNVQCDVVCRASFQELENAHVNYDTVQWCLISCLFILVYGVGLLLLLYVPVRRYIVRKDIQNRELYVTTQAVVYKVTAAFHVVVLKILSCNPPHWTCLAQLAQQGQLGNAKIIHL